MKLPILRNFIDNQKPLFVGQGKYSKWFPIFDAIENFIFSSKSKTANPIHVRDSIDIQRVMVIVWLSTFPVMFFGMYNIGDYGLNYLNTIGASNTGDWHHLLISIVGYENPTVFSKFWFGAVYFVPIYFVAFTVGIFWEIVFAVIRKHEINEGLFVSSVLFALTCPPDLPLWQAALGMTFGIVIGKEIFGGTGKNFLNPALTGRAFLYFAYPSQISGDRVWIAGLSDQNIVPEGYSGATPLAYAAESGTNGLEANFSWSDAFFGFIPGSVGETSVLLIAVSAIILLMTSFTRIVIVLSFIRSALSLQGAPSNQIIIGLAFFMSLFVMAPTWAKIQTTAVDPYSAEQITGSEALNNASSAIKEFMLKQTRPQDMELFVTMARIQATEAMQLPLNVVSSWESTHKSRRGKCVLESWFPLVV